MLYHVDKSGLELVGRSIVEHFPGAGDKEKWKWQDRGYWIVDASSYRNARVPAPHPHMTRRLPDPDPRVVECDLIRTSYQRRVRNPATKPVSSNAA